MLDALARIKDGHGTSTAIGTLNRPAVVPKMESTQSDITIPARLRKSLFQRFIGRTADIAVSTCLILALLPLILLIAICIRFSGKGVIYWQLRIGQNGKTFRCLKFRTMVANADQVLNELLKSNAAARQEWAETHKLKDDPRITPIGSFLRKTSLDELPQLFNVLKGDMSLIGPRPIVKEEILRYGRRSINYLAAKPGLTGLWQISGRNNMTYRRRVAIDVYYSRNRSISLNIYIFIKTVFIVLSRHGAY